MVQALARRRRRDGQADQGDGLVQHPAWSHRIVAAELAYDCQLCLASNSPISLAWGPQHVQIYNDGYWPICGGKHPQSMGQDFRECWAAPWPVIGEALSSRCAGKTAYLENMRMFLDRHGFLEETFFTFSFSPISDESGGVGGLFHPVTETTANALPSAARAAARPGCRAGKAKTVREALRSALDPLGATSWICRSCYSTRRRRGATAPLLGSASLAAGSAVAPDALDAREAARWPLAEAIRTRAPVT